MKRAIWILVIFAFTIAGCSNSAMPYLGHWTGKFEVARNSSDIPTEAVDFGGYVHLYRTGSKFLSVLSTPSQEIDSSGTWKMISTNRISLHFAKFNIVQDSVKVLEAKGEPIMSADAIHKAFADDLILDLSNDKEHLTGLLMHIGPLQGSFKFDKVVGPHR